MNFTHIRQMPTFTDIQDSKSSLPKKIVSLSSVPSFEPRCEKTGLQGFRTATEDSQRLEISDLRSRGIILSV